MNPFRFMQEVWRFKREMFAGWIRGNDSVIARRLRRRMFRTPCMIDTGVRITDARRFSAGPGSALYHGCYILNAEGAFSIGANSHLGAYCYVNVCHGRVTIGDDVAVGPGTKIIAYSNHYEPGRKVTDVRLTEDVSIGGNVFIGANCVILPGTVIADHVVVAAGSVVKGTLEGDAIYGGIPCRKIKDGWHG